MSRKPTTLISCAKWHKGTPSDIVVIKAVRNDRPYTMRRCTVCVSLMSAAGNQRRWVPDKPADLHAPYGAVLGVHALTRTPPEQLV